MVNLSSAVTILALLLVCPSPVIAVVVYGDVHEDNNSAIAVPTTPGSDDADTNNIIVTPDQRHHRDLRCESVAAYHPNYLLPWNQGKCELIVTCNSPSYSTELDCCKGAYGGQVSNYCISQLANPPTTQPTKIGGPDVYYPDYTVTWSEGICINTTPVPSGRPTYNSMLACCKAAYGGQMSMACIQALPTPPTGAPTILGGGVFYPDYSLPWPEGKCINTVPVPNGRPAYTTELACCKGAYGGQMSMTCIKDLPNPPTPIPTKVNPTVWYPDYSLAWTDGKCITTVPVPSGRPIYTTQLGCCRAAYTGQMSRTCIMDVTTFAPTNAPSTATPTNTCFTNKNDLTNAISVYTSNNCSLDPSSAACGAVASWGWPIGTWCTSLITDMSFLFRFSTFNEDISGWDVRSVTNMESMFQGATAFDQNIGAWNVGSVTNMKSMFQDAYAFNQNIGSWNVASVTDMSNMFVSATLFNQNIGSWNVGSVTDMSFMFRSASVFNQNISVWNLGVVTDMTFIFYGASAFNQNMCAWKNKIPYASNTAMFDYAACTDDNTPTSPSGPFCAVSTCPS
jgi:surface protein